MNKETSPLVTVLMPCYNAEKYLDSAIDSIVNQSYQNLHILLIDDGSTDATFEICNKWVQKDKRIECLRNEENLGLIKTLNKGINYTSNPYIARMDADDISALNRIEKQVNFLLQHHEIGVVGSQSLPIGVDGKRKRNGGSTTYLQPDTLSFSCFFTQPFFHGSILCKTEILKANMYSEEFKHSEDFELWLRLNSKGIKFRNLDEILYYYRINPEGVSISNERTQIESHNKASLFYLEKNINQPVDMEVVGILNNRPTQKVSYQKFKESMAFFQTFYGTQRKGKEQKHYFIRQRLDICIQSLKHSNHLKDKIAILFQLTLLSMNVIAIQHLLNKMN